MKLTHTHTRALLNAGRTQQNSM